MTSRPINRIRALALTAIAALAILALGAGQASAKQLQTFELANTFNTNLQFGEAPWDIASDEETGYVYAVDHDGGLYKFDENGNPVPFTAPEYAGSNVITPSPHTTIYPSPGGRVVVDNSGTATEGRIYDLDQDFQTIHAYEPSGKEITTGKWPLNVEDIVPSQFNPGDIAVDGEGHLWDEEEAGFSFVREFNAEGENTYVRMGASGQAFALDSENNEYIGSEYGYNAHGISKFTTDGAHIFELPPSNAISSDVSTDELYAVSSIFGERNYVNQYLPNGTRVARFKAAQESYTQLQSINYNHTNGRLYVGYYGQINILEHGPTVTVPDVTTDPASKFEPTSVEVHGTVNPDGVETTSCNFLWGPSAFNLTHSTACDQGDSLTGSTAQEVSTTLPGLTFGETYYYQLQVKNAKGEELGREISFVTSEAPSAEKTYASEVHSDSAVVHATILPGGAATTVHVEYGPAPCSANPCSDSEHVTVPAGTKPQKVAITVAGLGDGATYYYRLVAGNQSGGYTGTDKFFTTFPYEAVDDPCENAHVRQQTGAARLLDCRAYELVSAANASGYDVESDLSPGQEPLGGYPAAGDRALYAVHSGAISGVGAPANRGPDPYLATRGPQEWTTEYVGIPSDNPNATESFASTLLEADPALDTFAFGGPEICSPCFEDGSTNLPLRLPDKKLVEGMVGSEGEAAEPSGYIGRSFSADGRHLIFGTTEKLEPTGNEGGSDTTIYERDLKAGTTQVVSTLPDESTIASGADVGELDVSADGSRVVVGELLATDSAGNHYWHLYMHVGSSAKSIDLTPGATDGVLYDGMSADGTKVYFTTKDALTTASNQDSDTSADIYLAEVGGTTSTLSRVSYGSGAGNTDACEPPAGWNSVEGGNNCDVVAIAGGGGVASESGTIFFISPEKLDTSGATQPVQNQANLYEAAPGTAPRFIATVDSSIGKPPPAPPKHKEANPAFATNPSSVWGSMSVDQQTGDLYALDEETGNVHRWKSNGEPDDFAATGNNELHVGETFCCGEYQIAVDSSAGPYSGYLYFATNTEEVKAFNSNGEEAGALSGLGEACGVAVDASNGDVYVGTFGDTVSRFVPKTGAGPTVENGHFEPKTGMTAPGMSLCNIDASTDGHVYLWPYTGGEVTQYDTSEFTKTFPILGGRQFGPGINVQSDPESGLVYVLSHEGEVIDVYTPEGKHIEEFTGEEMYFAHGLAVDAESGQVYSGLYERIIAFEAEAAPYEPIDNPLVRDGVLHSGTHSYRDFQATPSGRYAAFATTQPIDATYDNELHYEVYRYDGQEEELVCASCNPSNSAAEGDSSLAAKGLSLTNDGTVFFNSSEALVARDLDNKQDAYEYENGELQLISTGVSPFASSLLGATADGKDAFFFTRDTLVPQDENGSLVKLYDAREAGGYPYVPPEAPCKASDECHGRGTEAPPAPDINTLHGGTGNVTEPAEPKKPACKKNRVRKHGKCVKRHTNKRRHARARGHRHG